MDTSETYIKQCEKAVEIQELWCEGISYSYIHATVGDWVQLKSQIPFRVFTKFNKWKDKWEYTEEIRGGNQLAVITNTNGDDYGGGKVGFGEYKAIQFYIPAAHYFTQVANVIWLPRQDQLQAMLNPPQIDLGCSPVILVSNLYKFVFSDYEKYTVLFKSMEQLTLAFVMFKLYQKKWDGTEWVKNES